ncbi:hypothetical protein [Hydrocarboniphaga sp.]|uniref:hypothetical protein n=1 Tax=Hydrocarboniphaga sp. TaxID=2033016 RepID=UPI003D0DF35A
MLLTAMPVVLPEAAYWACLVLQIRDVRRAAYIKLSSAAAMLSSDRRGNHRD